MWDKQDETTFISDLRKIYRTYTPGRKISVPTHTLERVAKALEYVIEEDNTIESVMTLQAALEGFNLSDAMLEVLAQAICQRSTAAIQTWLDIVDIILCDDTFDSEHSEHNELLADKILKWDKKYVKRIKTRDMREYQRHYRESHKSERKLYEELHKDDLKAYNAEYYENNKKFFIKEPKELEIQIEYESEAGNNDVVEKGLQSILNTKG